MYYYVVFILRKQKKSEVSTSKASTFTNPAKAASSTVMSTSKANTFTNPAKAASSTVSSDDDDDSMEMQYHLFGKTF